MRHSSFNIRFRVNKVSIKILTLILKIWTNNRTSIAIFGSLELMGIIQNFFTVKLFSQVHVNLVVILV
jgi:hypothetical protein